MEKSEKATEVAVQAFAEHVSVLKVPDAEQVATPPPLYPCRHVTVTASPVLPAMEPASA